MMVDWHALFAIQVPIAEIVLRGSAMFWFLFLLFRFALRRDVGAVGIADILVLVIVADAAQNAMAGDYKTITEGAMLVSVIVGWNLLLDWLAFRFPRVARFAQPSVLPLVRHGQILRANLRQEMLSEADLMSQLRQQGIEKLSEVKHVFMEADGQISVIKQKAEGDTVKRAKRPTP
jgi:uncharacterized membrane protein YcaP (DUF421 family)